MTTTSLSWVAANADSIKPTFDTVARKYLGEKPDIDEICGKFENDSAAKELHQKIPREPVILPKHVWYILEKWSIEDIAWYATNFNESSLVDWDFPDYDEDRPFVYIALRHLLDRFWEKKIPITLSRDMGFSSLNSEEKEEINALISFTVNRLEREENTRSKTNTIVRDAHAQVDEVLPISSK